MVSIRQDSEALAGTALGFNPSPEFFDSVPDETIREAVARHVVSDDALNSNWISDFRSGVFTALLMSAEELSPELVVIAEIVSAEAATGDLRTFTEAQRRLAELHTRLQESYVTLKAMYRTYHALEALKEQEDQDE